MALLGPALTLTAKWDPPAYTRSGLIVGGPAANSAASMGKAINTTYEYVFIYYICNTISITPSKVLLDHLYVTLYIYYDIYESSVTTGFVHI